MIEAEDFDENNFRSDSEDWEVQTASSGFSGTGYTIFPNGGYSNGAFATSAQLVYKTQFSTTGTYYVFGRIIASSGADNSAYIGIDGVQSSSTANSSTPSNWDWVSFGTITVSQAGIADIELVRREDGLQIDKIVLSTTNSIPTGTGPAATPCASGPSGISPYSIISAALQGGTTVNFDGTSSTDTDGSIVSYLWDFGDGSTVPHPPPLILTLYQE